MDLDINTEFSAEELCRSLDLNAIGNALCSLLDAPLALRTCKGTLLYGEPELVATQRHPLTLDFEPIAWLESARTDPRLSDAAALLQTLLRNRARYQMAADMHKSVTMADFEALQQSNAELAAANERYRALAASLEQKVEEQVRTIEAGQRRLFESAKLAAVGQLAAGVAHEINNPIGFINSNCSAQARYQNKLQSFFDDYLDQLPAAVRAAFSERKLDRVLKSWGEVIEESMAGCRRVRDIVQALRVFASIDQEAWSAIDLNAMLDNVLNIIRCRFHHAHCISLDSSAVPFIHGQPGYIAEACYSLLSNALEAAEDAPEPAIEIHFEAGPDSVSILISDNGPGIAPQDLERAFDPFFTTKAVGAGTGLGLSSCRDIATAHGGTVHLRNRQPRGVEARLTLPLGGHPYE